MIFQRSLSSRTLGKDTMIRRFKPRPRERPMVHLAAEPRKSLVKVMRRARSKAR